MKIKRSCLKCNKEFEFRACPTDVATGRGKYCSKKCSRLARRTLPRTYKCIICGKRRKNKYGKIKRFCSLKCGGTGRIPAIKGKTKKDYPKLANSGVKKGNIPSNKGQPRYDIRGEKNNLWKGGKTQLRYPRETVEYHDWKRSVFARDNWTCQKCKVRGGKLQADHIKWWALYPELRYEISNGQTLCRKCHRKKTNKELSEYFKQNGKRNVPERNVVNIS